MLNAIYLRFVQKNMVKDLGDGLTDVPCMKLVKLNGGHSIAVYPDGGKEKAGELLQADRVNFISAANYCEGGELNLIAKDIIRRIAAHNRLD